MVNAKQEGEWTPDFDLDQFADATEKIRQAITGTNQFLASVQSCVDELAAKVTEAKDQEILQTYNERLGDIDTATRKLLEQLTKKNGDIAGNLDTMLKKVKELSTRQQDIEQAAKDLGQLTDKLKDWQKLTKAAASMQQQVEAQEKQLAALEQAAKQAAARQQEVKASVAENIQAFQELQKWQETLTSCQSVLTSASGTLHEGVAALDGQTQKVSAALDDVHQYDDRLDKLEQQLTQGFGQNKQELDHFGEVMMGRISYLLETMDKKQEQQQWAQRYDEEVKKNEVLQQRLADAETMLGKVRNVLASEHCPEPPQEIDQTDLENLNKLFDKWQELAEISGKIRKITGAER
ncbi:hypothetical protein DWZ54_03855 [Mitsuokella sp. AF33-22]|uniref:hypothetical protein n=1 Tax=Mitsuokella sp. AF33-22 TaxID=2292047 RepID=UPI000E50B3F8|nr:hypothetical protein [Mitsuokella sp. AF33-22]RHM56475.1 hypothetical protein DWZ54_03855 [Mitsuokella sp. AF33-22]